MRCFTMDWICHGLFARSAQSSVSIFGMSIVIDDHGNSQITMMVVRNEWFRYGVYRPIS